MTTALATDEAQCMIKQVHNLNLFIRHGVAVQVLYVNTKAKIYADRDNMVSSIPCSKPVINSPLLRIFEAEMHGCSLVPARLQAHQDISRHHRFPEAAAVYSSEEKQALGLLVLWVQEGNASKLSHSFHLKHSCKHDVCRTAHKCRCASRDGRT